MEDDEKALKNEGEEENIPDAPPAAEKKDSEEVPEPKAEATVEAKGEEAETGEGSKKGENQRIRQLVKEKNKAKAEVKSLADKVAELTAPVEPQARPQFVPQPTTPQPDEPIVKPGEEIDAAELDRRLIAREQKLLRRTDAIVTLRGKQQDAITRYNNEANEAMKTYPELDPDSDDFNRELSESVTEAVEAHIKANPLRASVKKFTAKLMRPYKRAVAKEAGKVTENVAKQASETALRPTSVKSGEKKFEDLTEKEMEDKLGMVY